LNADTLDTLTCLVVTGNEGACSGTCTPHPPAAVCQGTSLRFSAG
jgi:hypothetical protein